MIENKDFSKPTLNLFKQWEDQNISYCHWKSSDHLEASFLAQTDLDVLVDRKDSQSAIILALECGFVELKSSHFRGYPSVRDFVCYDEELNRWVHLHYHTQLICGDRWVKAYHLPFEDLVLQNRVRHTEFNIWNISPDYELLILIYRMNAKFRKNWLLDKKIQEEIKYIISTKDLYPSSLEEDMWFYLNKKAVLLYNELFSEKINFEKLKIGKFRKEFQVKSFRRMTYWRFFFLSKLRYFYRVYSEVRRRMFKNYSSGRRSMLTGGLVITFVGIDGSGKSSGIKRVESFFSKQVNIQSNFLGSGKSGASLLRKSIMTLFGFKAKFKGHKALRDQQRDVVNIERKNLKKPPFYYLLWIWLCTVDRKKQLKKIRWGLANGNLVFVDRWLQDSVEGSLDAARLNGFVSFGGLVGKVARCEQRLYEEIKWVPLHQVIRLNITPEISVKRKPGELTLNDAANAIKSMSEIQWPIAAKITDINATEPIEEVTKDIVNSIWQTMQKYK